MATIPHDQFARLRKELAARDEEREQLIKQARALNVLAKQAMHATHRGDLEKAKRVLAEADPVAAGFIKGYEEEPWRKVGAVTAALQEWGECKAYYVYATEGRLAAQDELGLEAEDYLLALADLTGELTRKAVMASIDKDAAAVRDIRSFVDELLGLFLSFDFRNGELRKKTDAVRWNLQKIEELLAKQG
ncbi:hypothetical protein JXA12_03090 [Candidatus Woesearchaeota archaeon]|nr:hypothetical protein [Candidatus Woesearchaeota archaeon]